MFQCHGDITDVRFYGSFTRNKDEYPEKVDWGNFYNWPAKFPGTLTKVSKN